MAAGNPVASRASSKKGWTRRRLARASMAYVQTVLLDVSVRWVQRFLLDAQGSRRKNISFSPNSPDRESNIEKTAGSGIQPDPAVLLSQYVVLSFPVDHPDMGLSHSAAFGTFGAHTRFRSACRHEANTLPPAPGAHVLNPFAFRHICLLIVQ